MSNDKITIIPPEGYEAVQHDDGTVTFQVKVVKPGIKALSLTWSTCKTMHRYEVFTGKNSGWEPRVAVIDPALYADHPQYRNFVPQVIVKVVVAHPDLDWVATATTMLEDYLEDVFPSQVEDAIPSGEYQGRA